MSKLELPNWILQVGGGYLIFTTLNIEYMSRDEMLKDYSDSETEKILEYIRNRFESEDQDDEIYNHDIVKNFDWTKVDWAKSTGEKVLIHIRNRLEEKGYIEVVKTEGKDTPFSRKSWKKKKDIQDIKLEDIKE